MIVIPQGVNDSSVDCPFTMKGMEEEVETTTTTTATATAATL